MRWLLFLMLLSWNPEPAIVRGYKLSVNFPLVQKFEKDSIKLTNLKDTLPIFYYKNYVLYYMPYINIIEDHIKGTITEEKKYTYFAYRKTEKYGYTFDIMDDTSRRTKVLVDSFLQEKGFKSTFTLTGLKLIDSTFHADGNYTLEKYLSPKTDEYAFDSIYYYYSSSMNGTDYSLSEYQDSIRKDKLFLIRLLYNQYFSKSNNITMPKREFVFKIEKYDQFDPKPIIAFLDKF